MLYSFVNMPDARAELFCDLRKEIKTIGLLPGAKDIESVYGLTFHPQFETNRQCFVCYTLRGRKNEHNLPEGTRVSRFTVPRAEPPQIDHCSSSESRTCARRSSTQAVAVRHALLAALRRACDSS